MILVDLTPKQEISGPNFKNRQLSKNNNSVLLGNTFHLGLVRKNTMWSFTQSHVGSPGSSWPHSRRCEWRWANCAQVGLGVGSDRSQ